MYKYTLSKNQSRRPVPNREKKVPPTARHRDGMGVRERSFSRDWVKSNQRKEPLLARPSGSIFCPNLPPPPPPTLSSVSGRRPPLDSKEFQLAPKLAFTPTPHTNSENGKPTRGTRSGRARVEGRKKERGERERALAQVLNIGMGWLRVFNLGQAYLSRPSALVEGTCNPQRASVLERKAGLGS
jgi:hypothetical protein